MSIKGTHGELNSVLKSLPEAERKRIYMIVEELARRGKEIPPNFLPQKKHWPVDDRGYFVKNSGRKYTPSEEQKGFLGCKSYFVGFRGARGSGKTSAGAQKALQKIMSGNNGIIINPDFENLKISTWPEMREWIPWDMVVPSQKYRRNVEWQPSQPFKMAFINGVRVEIKGVKDPDSARGPNVNWLWYDEAQRDPDGSSWRTAVASVRVGKDPQAWATYTPNGKDHWTTKFFDEHDIPEEVEKLLKEVGYEGELITSFHGSMDDNKDNLDAGFMAAMLMAYPPGWQRQQEIYGEVVEQGGVLGNRAWFSGKIIPKIPEDVVIKARVRYWDLAATEKKLFKGRDKNNPDETVGTLMSWDGKNFYIENQVAGFWEWEAIKTNIVDVAKMDGPYVQTVFEQEPAAGGKNQVAELIKQIQTYLPNYPLAKGDRPEGDKVMRANPWFAEASQGLIWLIAGAWNMPFLDQLGCFPACQHDDKIDGVSGARKMVAPFRTWKKISFMHL